MPFRSEAQRRFLFAKKPEIAKEFAEKTPKGVKLPERVGKMSGPLHLIGKADERFSLPMIAVNFSEGEPTEYPEVDDYENMKSGKGGPIKLPQAGSREDMIAKRKDGGGPQIYAEQTMPDYEAIYGAGVQVSERQAEEELANRRRAAAAQKTMAYGFHGKAPEPQITWDPKKELMGAEQIIANRPPKKTNESPNPQGPVYTLPGKSKYIPPPHTIKKSSLSPKYESEYVLVEVPSRSDTAEALCQLLENIDKRGRPGHSFSIIEDGDSSKASLGGWDGDGADIIRKITRISSDKSEKVVYGKSLIHTLQKARPHKYYKRVAKPGGGYRYYYTKEEYEGRGKAPEQTSFQFEKLAVEAPKERVPAQAVVLDLVNKAKNLGIRGVEVHSVSSEGFTLWIHEGAEYIGGEKILISREEQQRRLMDAKRQLTDYVTMKYPGNKFLHQKAPYGSGKHYWHTSVGERYGRSITTGMATGIKVQLTDAEKKESREKVLLGRGDPIYQKLTVRDFNQLKNANSGDVVRYRGYPHENYKVISREDLGKNKIIVNVLIPDKYGEYDPNNRGHFVFEGTDKFIGPNLLIHFYDKFKDEPSYIPLKQLSLLSADAFVKEEELSPKDKDLISAQRQKTRQEVGREIVNKYQGTVPGVIIKNFEAMEDASDANALLDIEGIPFTVLYLGEPRAHIISKRKGSYSLSNAKRERIYQKAIDVFSDMVRELSPEWLAANHKMYPEGEGLPPPKPKPKLKKKATVETGGYEGLTVEKVKDWNWVTSPDHHGKIPEMSEQERRAWSELTNKKIDEGRIPKKEFTLWAALDRKLQYRAKKQKDRIP